MARRFDRAAVLALLVLGCIHNFVAAPASFGALDPRALWFVTGGIVLWYAAAINHVATQPQGAGYGRRIVFSCNLVLVGFATMFMWARDSWMNPQNVTLMAPALWLLFRSGLKLKGAPPARGAAGVEAR